MVLALVVEPPALVPVASPMASEVSGNYNISTAMAHGNGYKSGKCYKKPQSGRFGWEDEDNEGSMRKQYIWC